MHEQQIDRECEHTPPRRGTRRLLEDERRTRVLDAAETILLDKGYRRASMDEIAGVAGMSKKTIYQIYRTKTALFEALLRARFPVFPVVIHDDGRPPRAVLADALRQAVEHALSDRQIALFRMMTAESWRSGDDAFALKQLSAALLPDDTLEKWLAAKAAAGVLEVGDPRSIASWLLWGVAGRFVFHTLLHDGPRPTAAAVERQVRLMVSTLSAPSARGR